VNPKLTTHSLISGSVVVKLNGVLGVSSTVGNGDDEWSWVATTRHCRSNANAQVWHEANGPGGQPTCACAYARSPVVVLHVARHAGRHHLLQAWWLASRVDAVGVRPAMLLALFWQVRFPRASTWSGTGFQACATACTRTARTRTGLHLLAQPPIGVQCTAARI
jgi:predicted benzoate:H+ symporter BenE